MKIHGIPAAAAANIAMAAHAIAAAALAAGLILATGCKGGEKMTTIKGEAPEGVTEVTITCPAADFFTVCEIQDGSFAAEIPTCLISGTTLSFTDPDNSGEEDPEDAYFPEDEPQMIEFIADGTTLTVDFEDGTVTSDAPEASVQERMNAFQAYFEEFNSEYETKIREILDSEADEEQTEKMIEEFSNAKCGELADYCKALIEENSDNYLGATAFFCLMMVTEDEAELMEYLDKLSDELLENTDLAPLAEALQTSAGTSEGSQFADFEVTCVTGADAEGNPTTETRRLSDYVGRGKYVLVDFWASWCGPCRHEIPNIAEVYAQYAGEDFDVLGVAVWDNWQDTFDAVEAEGISWNIMALTEDCNKVPTDVYGIQGIPQIMLFGPDGTIVAKGLRGSAIAEKVAEVLGR